MKKLTWDELADIYDKATHGRPARTLPMGKVFDWAEKQTDKFVVNEDDSISKKETHNARNTLREQKSIS